MMEKPHIKKRKAYAQFYKVIGSLQNEMVKKCYIISSPVWDNLLLVNMPNEYWVEVHKYIGYMASNYGRIKSLPKRNRKDEIILKQYFDRGGYLYVAMNGKKEKIHRIVGFTFFRDKKTKRKYQINHKKGYKWHNVLINLEWSTPRDNQIHSYENGLKPKFFGSQNVRSIPVIQYDLNGMFIKEWESMKMAARAIGIDDAPIGKCCKKDINYTQAYGYVWRYKKDVIHLGKKGNLPRGDVIIKSKPKFKKRRETTEKNKLLYGKRRTYLLS